MAKGWSSSWASLLVLAALVAASAVWSVTTGAQTVAPSAGTGGSGTPPDVAVVRTGERIVSYHGVHVDVPASWPVVDGMHAGICDGPFGATPTAFVGPQAISGPSCGARPYLGRTPPAYDGVWLQPGDPPTGVARITTASGHVVDEEEPSAYPAPAIESLWYHHVLIEVGLGPDPGVAQAIVDSIGFTAGAPDTPAAGVCARSPDPGAMPVPERLTERLVLGNKDTDFTLDPPEPGDQATMPAAQAWNESGPKEWFERYRLILARYSSEFPARLGPHGTFIPMVQNELAWVVYSAPTSPSIMGCGGWGVVAFDAHSEQQIGDAGFSPGP